VQFAAGDWNALKEAFYAEKSVTTSSKKSKTDAPVV